MDKLLETLKKDIIEKLPWANITEPEKAFRGKELIIWDRNNDYDCLLTVCLNKDCEDVTVRPRYNGKRRKDKWFPNVTDKTYPDVIKYIITFAEKEKIELAQCVKDRDARKATQKAIESSNIPDVKSLFILPKENGCEINYRSRLSLSKTKRLAEFIKQLQESPEE